MNKIKGFGAFAAIIPNIWAWVILLQFVKAYPGAQSGVLISGILVSCILLTYGWLTLKDYYEERKTIINSRR